MASGGNSSSSYRRRVIRGSGDGSASSASGGPKFGIPRGENPRCHCGAYAIVVESGTDKNPRRPFFGCPYYRVRNIGYCSEGLPETCSSVVWRGPRWRFGNLS
ncbi:hypothetical protein HN51_031442 [Arachis hypogaea]